MRRNGKWDDGTYRLCWLAFLEIDIIERNKKLEDLKSKIGKDCDKAMCDI